MRGGVESSLKYFVKDLDWIDGLPFGLRRLYFASKRRSITNEKDPLKLVEKRVVMALKGTFEPGMAGSGAYLSFKREFYDKAETEENMDLIRRALLGIILSKRYSFDIRVMAAFASADIGFADATDGVRYLSNEAKPNSNWEGTLKMAMEALVDKKTIQEVISRRQGI